jgi:hypothetical protein
MNKKRFSLDISEVNIRPGTYRNVEVDFECEGRDILGTFTMEEILQVKNPDLSDILDGWSMEQVLQHYDIDDIVQYCRDQRIEGIVG